MRVPLGLSLAIVTLAACSSSPEEEAVAGALGELVAALQAKDPVRVWALSDEVSKHAVLDVVKTLEAAQTKVPMVWGGSCPAADAGCKATAIKEARAALGAPLIEAAGADDAGRGPRVLGFLVDLDKLSFGDHVMDGLGSRDMTFEEGPPRRVIVHTSGGDVFGFVDEGGSWRSLVVRDLVLDHPLVRELLANAKKTDGLAVERHRAWQLVVDPKSPQGAYNIARRMQSADPPDWKGLFSLLDATAQQALGTAMEKARLAQKKLQGRTTKGQRKDAYGDHGIALMVDATSDRDLYLRWARTPEFIKPLPATDEPASLEGDPDQGVVSIVTTSGKRIPMVRDAEGYWRIGEANHAIETALVAPAQKVLDAP